MINRPKLQNIRTLCQVFTVNAKIFFVLLSLSIFCNYSATLKEIFKPENLIIETERLVLRLIELEDLYDVFEFTSDPEVEKLTGMFALHTTYKETEHFIRMSLASYRIYSSISWAVICKPHNKVIGIFRLFSYVPLHRKAEVGYVLARPYWGQGIATEVLQAALKFCFGSMNLHRIYATADPRNTASYHVLKKCGFHYEGLLRDCYFFRGAFCDRMMFSILEQELESL